MFPDHPQIRDNLDRFWGQFADTKRFSGKVLESGLFGQSKRLKGHSKERVYVGGWISNQLYHHWRVQGAGIRDVYSGRRPLTFAGLMWTPNVLKIQTVTLGLWDSTADTPARFFCLWTHKPRMVLTFSYGFSRNILISRHHC